ncbi:unnamed protein product [Brassica napus]|uniref:(rape) hypothetical protein n=1 Tax=Brassica napus TaxID=3708 RepID=A0A816LJH1_BRANA|nr:unnamed protein product [Brassica napus]
MKSVAKCDTWCGAESVNHRVFERKLRPKPLGEGHVCLGDARSVLTCGGEFNSRQIVSRFGPKALDDPKSSTRPQSGEASSATDRAQVPWKGAPERVRARRARTLSHHEALSTSRVVWECSPNRAVNSVKAKYGRDRWRTSTAREADGGGDASRSDAEAEQSGPPDRFGAWTDAD